MKSCNSYRTCSQNGAKLCLAVRLGYCTLNNLHQSLSHDARRHAHASAREAPLSLDTRIPGSTVHVVIAVGLVYFLRLRKKGVKSEMRVADV